MATVVHEARRHPVVQVSGRVGMVIYGVVHVLVAWLAIQAVLGDSERRAWTRPCTPLAAQPFGAFLLAAVGFGMAAFGVLDGVPLDTERRPRQSLPRSGIRRWQGVLLRAREFGRPWLTSQFFIDAAGTGACA